MTDAGDSYWDHPDDRNAPWPPLDPVHDQGPPAGPRGMPRPPRARPTPVREAWPELLTLACSSRPDWPEDVTSGYFRQARDKGLTYAGALNRIARLVPRPSATPREIVPVPDSDPTAPVHADPGANERGAAAARAALVGALGHDPWAGDAPAQPATTSEGKR